MHTSRPTLVELLWIVTPKPYLSVCVCIFVHKFQSVLASYFPQLQCISYCCLIGLHYSLLWVSAIETLILCIDLYADEYKIRMQFIVIKYFIFSMQYCLNVISILHLPFVKYLTAIQFSVAYLRSLYLMERCLILKLCNK